MASRYIEQFERVKRYLNRFKQINDGKMHDQSSQNYDDDIYAFFQNCYHLKDWIKNDPTCSNWNNVENLINQETDLNICADLCNGLKHSTLTSHRSNENPNFGGGNINLTIRDGIGVKEKIDVSITYRISTSSGEIDAFYLANRCVSIWEKFINDNSTNP